VPKRSGVALLVLAFALLAGTAGVLPVSAEGDVQALIHYQAPENYHAMIGKSGENGTLYLPYHFIPDHENHSLRDIPYTLVIGPYYGLPDTFHLGIRYEHEASANVYIQPGDNITLIGHFYDEQGQELENPYLEVIRNEPFEPGYPPTTIPTVTTTTTTAATTIPAPSADERLLECLAGGPCSSCPADLCTERYDPATRFYPLSPYIGPDGKCSSSLAFSSTDGMAMVLLQSTVHLNWSGEYRYLKIAETCPPVAVDGSLVVGSAYELGPDDLQFSSAIELMLHYDPADLPPGAAEEVLYLGLWNLSTSKWDEVASTLEIAENTVVGVLSHFSVYAVVCPEVHGPTTTVPTTSAPPTTTTTPAMTTATLPSLTIITSGPDDTNSDLPWYAGLLSDLRPVLYSAAPPTVVIVLSVIACIGVLRWMR